MPAPSNRDVVQEIQDILKLWEEDQTIQTNDPTPHLQSVCEVLEREHQKFLKLDPDPFDDRHPVTQKPECALGPCLRALLKKDLFISKVVSHYTKESYYSSLGMNKDPTELNTIACRLLIDLLPGLDIPQVFRDAESTVQRLYVWAEKGPEPLRTYAIGLLGATMEISDFPATFREQNAKLMPILLVKLWELQQQSGINQNGPGLSTIPERPFENIGTSETPHDDEEMRSPNNQKSLMKTSFQSADEEMYDSDCSSSSWAEMGPYILGSYKIHPWDKQTTEMFILRYLRPVSEYQEALTHIFKYNAMDLVLHYINVRLVNHARLSFEALRFLGSLLFHKKFCVQFVCGKEGTKMTGVHKILQVPRPSLPADGVALCLWYLAFSEEAMEKVCQQSDFFISKLVTYAAWLLECSHQSSRTHAVMFFGLVFKYKAILVKFDEKDGLRRLFNLLSTIRFLQDLDEDNSDDLNIMWQTVKHVCCSIKSYFEAHLYIMVEKMINTRPSAKCVPPVLSWRPLEPHKAMYTSIYDEDSQTNKLVDYMLERVTGRTRWEPVEHFIHLKGINLLVQLIHTILEPSMVLGTHQSEAAVYALESLHIMSVLPRVQHLLCEKISAVPTEENDLIDHGEITGCYILMQGLKIEKNNYATKVDGGFKIQKASLKVLINCLCAPIDKVTLSLPTGRVSRRTVYNNEDIIKNSWNAVRECDGIMELISILEKTEPFAEADLMRANACRALIGLARSENVRQIMSKLKIFTSGQLQMLMKEPISQEKRAEFVAFQKNALELTKLVVGLTEDNNADSDGCIASIKKAELVSKTQVKYKKEQLLQLIQSFLVQEGFENVAKLLEDDAGLPPLPNNLAGSMGPPMHCVTSTPSSSRSKQCTPRQIPLMPPNGNDGPESPMQRTPLLQKFAGRKLSSRSQAPSPEPTGSFSKVGRFSSPAFAHTPIATKQEPSVSLEKIVKEYLLSQHSLCKHPVITCPEFDLLKPHRCPGYKSRAHSINFTNKFMNQPYRTRNHRDLYRKLVFSRYRPSHVFKPSDEGTFHACAFMTLVGDTGRQEAISALVPHQSGSLLLSSSGFEGESMLWTVRDSLDSKFVFTENHAEFNNAQDKIVTTTMHVAKLYDLNTGQPLCEFAPEFSNHYSLNKASLDPLDDILLTDGVLFDIRSGKQIYKFDKFNDSLSGQFHRNGLEVITSGEIWDLRTFHLLRTVPMLAQCSVIFNNAEDVIYAKKSCRNYADDLEENFQYPTSFTVLDAHDYSSITTIDVKKSVFDLDINCNDNQLAVVEGELNYIEDFDSEAVVKVYDIGMTRQEDDDLIDDEESDEDDDDSSDTDSNARDGADFEILSVDLASTSSDGDFNMDDVEAIRGPDIELNDDVGEEASVDEDDQWEDEEEVIEIGDDDDDDDDDDDVIIDETPS